MHGDDCAGVQFWARVLVAPERVQRVKHHILTMGQVFLKPGEILEIETRPGDDIEMAVAAGNPDIKRPATTCIVAWNEVVGDITIYGYDADHVAAIAEPVTEALAGRAPDELLSKAVWLHSDRINSIRIGNVHVFFELTEEKVGPIDEVDEASSEGDPDKLYAARFKTYAGASPLKVADAHLKLLKAIRALREAGLLPEAA